MYTPPPLPANMAAEEFRASEYVRVLAEDDELILQTREEAGRGKRFGTDGQVALEAEEAERLAKWILARDLEV